MERDFIQDLKDLIIKHNIGDGCKTDAIILAHALAGFLRILTTAIKWRENGKEPE